MYSKYINTRRRKENRASPPAKLFRNSFIVASLWEKALLTSITTPPFIEVCHSLPENVTQSALSATQKVGMTKTGRESDCHRQTDGDGRREATEEEEA